MQHRYDDVHDLMNPQFAQIREQGRNQISQVLTPEQRPKFEDYLKRLDEERRRRAGFNRTATPANTPNSPANPAPNPNSTPNANR
jgi:hypothetical protein